LELDPKVIEKARKAARAAILMMDARRSSVIGLKG